MQTNTHMYMHYPWYMEGCGQKKKRRAMYARPYYFKVVFILRALRDGSKGEICFRHLLETDWKTTLV